ncbi:MAG: hypothetical protein OWQ59_05460 [Alicyclobacillaceae bacterium]|jgi:hypothetical protein|uniref:hypothetical protein n=1 Tax=Alicyclobacillus sp. SP_1 TaxID=2942475 RepID=UPI0021577091|nr:hypothetical protein [Alicyclobacillus sp. SP_1]MCY0887887.1 hypothetical protein [Alicyclobacillaceae bacterium]
MDWTLRLLILTHLRTDILTFIFTGILIHVIDTRRYKVVPEYRREFLLTRIIARIYIIGGSCLYAFFQFLLWFT